MQKAVIFVRKIEEKKKKYHKDRHHFHYTGEDRDAAHSK